MYNVCGINVHADADGVHTELRVGVSVGVLEIVARAARCERERRAGHYRAAGRAAPAAARDVRDASCGAVVIRAVRRRSLQHLLERAAAGAGVERNARVHVPRAEEPVVLHSEHITHGVASRALSLRDTQTHCGR